MLGIDAVHHLGCLRTAGSFAQSRHAAKLLAGSAAKLDHAAPVINLLRTVPKPTQSAVLAAADAS
jgi:hypothetical protein